MNATANSAANCFRVAADPRTNGWIGSPQTLDLAARVTIEIPDQPGRIVSVTDLLADLPRVEQTTELKCIEG